MRIFLFVFKNGAQLPAPIEAEELEQLRKAFVHGVVFAAKNGTCINCSELVGCGEIFEVDEDPDEHEIPEA